jgi:hypothetical protein
MTRDEEFSKEKADALARMERGIKLICEQTSPLWDKAPTMNKDEAYDMLLDYATKYISTIKSVDAQRATTPDYLLNTFCPKCKIHTTMMCL